MTELEFKEKMEKLEEIIKDHRHQDGPLMPVLHETQELFGYIPEDAQKRIALGLNVPMAEIYGVATFYSRFTLKPRGKYTISICLGTACYVRNAQAIIEKFQDELKVEPGATSEDGIFTLEATRCLGCCGLAPVAMIGEDVYGKLVPEDVPGIIKKYRD